MATNERLAPGGYTRDFTVVQLFLFCLNLLFLDNFGNLRKLTLHLSDMYSINLYSMSLGVLNSEVFKENLETLSIVFPWYPDVRLADLEHCSQFRNLKELTFDRIKEWHGVSPEIIQRIATGCKSLEKINITRCEGGFNWGVSLSAFARECPNFKFLDISLSLIGSINDLRKMLENSQNPKQMVIRAINSSVGSEDRYLHECSDEVNGLMEYYGCKVIFE